VIDDDTWIVKLGVAVAPAGSEPMTFGESRIVRYGLIGLFARFGSAQVTAPGLQSTGLSASVETALRLTVTSWSQTPVSYDWNATR